MKRATLRQSIGALIILFVAWVMCRGLSTGESTLLKRATSVCGSNGAFSDDQSYTGYFAAKYYYTTKHAWLSDNQLFVHYNLEHNQLHFRALKLDVPKGTEIPLRHLEALFDGTNTARPFLWQMSPDGRWLLTVYAQSYDVIFSVMSLDGVVARSWTNRWMSAKPIWLTHSRAFMEQIFDDGNYYVRLYRLDSPRMERFALNTPSIIAPPREFGSEPMAVLPECSQPESVEVVSFDFRPTDTTMRKFAFRVPQELRDSDWTVFPSPGGDRLAWIASYRQKIPHVTLQHGFPFLQAEARYIGCLWVSHADGTQMRELGRLRPGEEIHQIVWMPNGRQMSFVLRERIWEVPAE